jgi:hypothetical protein
MKTLATPIVATLLAGLSFLSTPVSAHAKSPIAINKNSAVGEETFSISVRQVSNSETVRLVIYKNSAKRLLVKLKTADGITIDSYYTDRQLQQEGKDYNFRDADEGTYTLEVSDGKSTVTKQINLKHIEVKELSKLNIQ